MSKPTDIRVVEVRMGEETHRYRRPMKFGGRVVESVTILNVTCRVETRLGKQAVGFGSMPLGNLWAFPSARLAPIQTLRVMRELSVRFARILQRGFGFGHALDLGLVMEEHFLAAAAEYAAQNVQVGPIPKLAILVCGSAFDAALHDAFGKVHGLNCYKTYTDEFLSRDLPDYLGSDFLGRRLHESLESRPPTRLPLYHLVGALDPLHMEELTGVPPDGLPELLGEWIDAEGLTHFKIKLNGDDIAWDLNRILSVDSICARRLGPNTRGPWRYSLDFNERCQTVDYLIDLLKRLQRDRPSLFDRIHYIEQPTARDLAAHPWNRMHQAARLKPVVIDESLVDLDTLILARDMGYTGVALKACKGQTQSLLMAAAAHRHEMMLCVQDLTCPGASLAHSVGLATHIRGATAIEANARQYCPEANLVWIERHPNLIRIRDGTIGSDSLAGPGLSACPDDLRAMLLS